MQVVFAPSGYVAHLPDEVETWAGTFSSSMMDTDELLHLAGTLATYPWDGRSIIVEIGAYLGQTTVFMAQVVQALGKMATILSIDPFERTQPDALNPQGSYPAYLHNIQSHGVEHMCLPLAAYSRDAAPVVPEHIGVLVIDGSHLYPDVTQDLILYGPKVLPNGLLFIDDYGPMYPDVVRAVDEYFSSGCPFDILHQSHYIVAVRHPENEPA